MSQGIRADAVEKGKGTAAGKLSEVNYKALAQHYGFETFLLDLTNDVRNALFFATCKWVEDHFEPLTEEDIMQSERSRYGVIYHTPDWMIDFMNGDNLLKLQPSFEKEMGQAECNRHRVVGWSCLSNRITAFLQMPYAKRICISDENNREYQA